jgi:hypothetical protein
MKVLQTILVIALVSALAMLARQQRTLSQHEQQIQALEMALSDKIKQEALSSQDKCADIANRFLSNRRYERTDGFEYQSHFNAKLNRCFVFVSDYEIKGDLLSLDLFDAAEGKHYAWYHGHNICDVSITHDPRKCLLDSGNIWFDGNDTKTPADFITGFRGLRFGGGAGDENTQRTFRDHIEPFMSD